MPNNELIHAHRHHSAPERTGVLRRDGLFSSREEVWRVRSRQTREMAESDDGGRFTE